MVTTDAPLENPTTITSWTGATHGNWTGGYDGTTPAFTGTLPTEKDETSNLRTIWSIQELNILGGFLWLAVIITLIGNFSCFYAVWKNLKKILEHPFFQSNVFCVLLSVTDVLLVLLVGIPAAIFFSTGSTTMGKSMYNLAVVEPILDYLVWLQLLIVVAICADRAGHICRPLTYTFSIKARKTAIACFLCIVLPFILLTVPCIVYTTKTLSLNREHVAKRNMTDDAASELATLMSFRCKEFAYNNGTDVNAIIFMSCTVAMPGLRWPEHKKFLHWENAAHPIVLLLAVFSLLFSNGLIIRKLFESAAFQKDNAKRQEEVSRSIRMNSIVSTVQAVLLLVCTLPMRVYQMEVRLADWDDCSVLRGTKDADGNVRSCMFNPRRYSHHYIIITKVLVFLGPMINPWLYPIRMASIRAFLATKKRSVVSSVNTSLLRLRTGGTMLSLSTASQKVTGNSEI